MRFHSIGVAAIAHMAASAGISAGARMSKMTLILQGLFSSGISIFSRLSCCWFARGSVMRGQDPVGHSAHHLHALFIPHPSGEASHVAKPRARMGRVYQMCEYQQDKIRLTSPLGCYWGRRTAERFLAGSTYRMFELFKSSN